MTVITVDLESPAVDVSAPIDARDIELVQQTFARVAMLGADNVGKVLFMKIFKKAPQALQLFSFGAEGLSDPYRLWRAGGPAVGHAAKVVTTVATAVGLLNNLDQLVPVLQDLGMRHHGYGIVPAHYDVVGEALIESLQLALGPLFTTSVQNAYLKVYTTVKSVMTTDPAEIEAARAAKQAEITAAAEAEQAAADAAAAAAAAASQETTEVSEKQAAEDKKKEAAAKKKAQEEKKKKEISAKKKAEDEAKKKAEAEAKKKAEQDVKLNEQKEKAKERLAAFKQLEKKDQEELTKKIIGHAKSGNVNALKDCLENNADPNATDGDGQCALHYAADGNKKDICICLLEYGADPKAAVKLGEWGMTPLHYAARQGYTEIAQIVYDKKASQTKNFQGKLPAELAESKGNEEIVQLIKKLDKKK
eukprot:TRINITY_DN45119_c0_g1_i1.p1 TRINITY_DN45119_c0_g1~~TRINITY_DN45119_c0_g1_i1.p1  ORF type:complete len:419 (+),score=114.49 TRINITY_DN45119_c0_g1_i1:111-1367(+)